MHACLTAELGSTPDSVVHHDRHGGLFLHGVRLITSASGEERNPLHSLRTGTQSPKQRGPAWAQTLLETTSQSPVSPPLGGALPHVPCEPWRGPAPTLPFLLPHGLPQPTSQAGPAARAQGNSDTSPSGDPHAQAVPGAPWPAHAQLGCHHQGQHWQVGHGPSQHSPHSAQEHSHSAGPARPLNRPRAHALSLVHGPGPGATAWKSQHMGHVH